MHLYPALNEEIYNFYAISNYIAKNGYFFSDLKKKKKINVNLLAIFYKFLNQ